MDMNTWWSNFPPDMRFIPAKVGLWWPLVKKAGWGFEYIAKEHDCTVTLVLICLEKSDTPTSCSDLLAPEHYSKFCLVSATLLYILIDSINYPPHSWEIPNLFLYSPIKWSHRSLDTWFMFRNFGTTCIKFFRIYLIERLIRWYAHVCLLRSHYSEKGFETKKFTSV